MTRRELDRTALALGAQACIVLMVCTACAPSPVNAPSAEPTMVQTQQNEVEQLSLSQRELGDLLRELDTTLPPESARQLHDTQAQWEALAHDECSWQRDLSGGGSMSSLVYATCLDRRLRDRIDWLKLFLCEGYGSTGECQASKRY